MQDDASTQPIPVMPIIKDVSIKSKVTKFKSQAEWSRQFFDMLNDHYFCNVLVQNHKCGAKFSKNTRDSHKVDHLIKVHSMQIPTHLIRKKSSFVQQPITNFLTMEEASAQNIQNIVLAFAFNPTMPFKVIDDQYFRRAFGCKVEGFNSVRLKKEILNFAEMIQNNFISTLDSQMVSIVLDGGKDIANNKLISVGVKTHNNMCIYDVIERITRN